MTILHVSDLHFHQRWYNWLLDHAPAHDLLAISGDLLDLTSPVSFEKQVRWVSAWIRDYGAPLAICSGNHDLEWNAARETWHPAYWLRDLATSRVWVDGQHITLGDTTVLVIGCTRRPKGGDADIWVVHAAPSHTLVAQRTGGELAGDPDLIAPVRRHAPRVVLSGHVHDPAQWSDEREGVLYLNPGRDADARFPHHILLDTGTLAARRITDEPIVRAGVVAADASAFCPAAV